MKNCENWSIFSEDMDKVRQLTIYYFLGHPVQYNYSYDLMQYYHDFTFHNETIMTAVLVFICNL